jgi:ligand-binding sensor domain-containing protein/two-component sensor histidine kinase
VPGLSRKQLVDWARIVAVASLWAVAAYGLDPNRNLTQYVHRVWETEQGLPEVKIDILRQTKDGYLWLGTYSGLVRFDGVRFTTVQDPQSILRNVWIRSVAEDAQQRLWLGTNGAGLVRLENGVFTHYGKASGLPSDSVYCVLPDRHGDIWACTANGIARLQDGTFQVFGAAQGLPTETVFAACEAKDGTLWAGSENSAVSVWDGSRFRARPLRTLPPETAVRAMYCQDGGSLWVGTARGLVRIQDGKERLFTTTDGLAGNFIDCLSESRDGSLWIGTRNGFSRMRNGEFESFRLEDGLSQRMVNTIFEDHEGSLWVGTMHGLDQFLDGRSIPYTAREGLPGNHVGPVLEDSRGDLWVGMLDKGLVRFDGRRFSVLDRSRGVADTIYALAEDGGTLWAGTAAGVARLRDGRIERTYTTRDGLPSNVVRSLLRDHAGGLWAGTAAGPAMLRNGRFMQPPALRDTLQVPIMAMGEDGRGQLYFGTSERGIYVFAGGALHELVPRDGPVVRAGAFYTDRDGFLWIGTIGTGLKLVRDGKITTYLTRDGLFDHVIFGIAADTSDRLWLACSKGIFSVSRSDLLQFAEGKIRHISPSPIDMLRPVESLPGIQPAVWCARDGRLWFSTTAGIVAFDPGRQPRQSLPPSVVIENVMVNGEIDRPTRIRRLPPGRKNLEFQYTALSFLEPGRILFRYILDGFDKDWTDAGGRREAFYTNLPPGDYRFRVTACNADGICNETGSSVSFTLAPHYYQTSWFLMLCAATAALVVWAFHRMRVRWLNERLDLVLAERNRIARELHDTLIQGFSGITMQMQALAARLRSSEERDTLQEIIRDAGDCLRETRRSVEGLRGGQTPGFGLTSAIAAAACQITQASGVRLKLNLQPDPGKMPAEIQYTLLRIAQEAISNSIRHSGARNIEVDLHCTSEGLRLSVKDDGSGFLREANGTVRPGHYGLLGMEERASEIGVDLRIASAPGEGTTVSVLVPAIEGEHERG